MVCLSSRSPNSEALLRYASRLAGRLNRNWYALYVQTPRENPTVIDSETQRILAGTLTLAQELGAMVFTYKGDDIVKTILRFAKEYRVGHIVTGSPGKKVPFFKRLRGEVSMVERLINEGKGFTVVVLDTRGLPGDVQNVERYSVDKSLQAKERIKDGIRLGKPDFTTAGAMIWDTMEDKEHAIRQLLNLCSMEDLGDKDSVLAALFERERDGGTYAGEDVVIPHARIEGLTRTLIAAGIGKAGIFDRESNRRVSIMFLLLSPWDTPENHIDALSMIGRMARDDRFMKRLRNAATPGDASGMIGEWADDL
jgi:two-component system sensor histidine kinase KdpD